MRRRFRYDPDLETVVEIGGNYFEEAPQGPAVISDDLGHGVDGLKHLPSGRMIDSKSGHRAENRARGLVEVGNETDFADKRERPKGDYYVREVIDAKQQIEGNYNGTADRLAREREQSRRD
jgi:hypothetical protein